MPPQQTPQLPNRTPQPNGGHNPYEFIMSPQQTAKKPLFTGGTKGLLFAIGGLAVIVVLLVVIVSLFSGNDGSAKAFIAVAQKQQELARVAELEQSSLTSVTAKNLAVTTELSMQTDGATLTNYLSKHGVKTSKKQLAARTNSATDTKLQNAVQSNTLDSTLIDELQAELTSYQDSLRQAYQATSGPHSRALILGLNKNVELLLAQSKQQ